MKFVAGQLKVDPELFAGYAWSGRTAEYRRAQIRPALGFREPTVGDEDKLVEWLASEVRRAEPGPAAARASPHSIAHNAVFFPGYPMTLAAANLILRD